MPLTPKGKKIIAAMESEYGAKKGKAVFYASANKGKITGVHHSPDRYDDQALGERPARKEYHTRTEQGTGDLPSATGVPAIQTNDPTGNPRAETKTLQSGHLTTPSGSDKFHPEIQSYAEGEV